MASETKISGATAPMDYKEHEATYELFVRMTAVLTPVFISWVVALAIGATKGSWFFCAVIVVLSSIAGIVGLFSKNLGYKPAMATLVLGLLLLLVL